MDNKKFQTGNVITIAFAHFFHDVYSAFLAPMLPLLREKLSLNYTLMSLLFVFQRLPSLFNPLIGIIAENIKVRYLVILSPAVTTVCMSLLGLSGNYILLILLLFTVGISSAFFHVPTPVLMKRMAGNRLGKGMSFYMIGGEAARTIGPLVISAAISLWGLEGTYRLIPFGLIASLVLYFKFRNVKITEDIAKKKKEKGIRETFIKHRYFFILIGLVLLFRGFMKSAIVSFLPTYMDEMGQSLWFGSSSLSIFEFAGVVGVYLAGSYSDKLGRLKMLYAIIFVTPFLMLFFVFVKGFLMLPVLIFLGFFVLASTPVMIAMVLEIDKEHQSFLNGVFMTLSFVVTSSTTFLVGILSDLTDLQSTFKLTSYIGFAAIPVMFLLNKRYKKKIR